MGAELRSGHLETPNSSRRGGMRAAMARQRNRPFGAPEFTSKQKRALAFTYATVFMMLVYFATLGTALFQPDFTIWDRIGSLMLIFGLAFIFLHGLGYANSMIKASWTYREFRTHLFSPTKVPRVVCIVASFNEPAEVLDETIGSVVAMEYPNKEIVILDDSTKEEARQAARDIAAKYGVRCVQRTTRRGYKAGAINDFLPTTDAPYLAIFDADALPATNFLREVLPIIDENPRLAFLQTPQFYANTEVSNVAMASARQQDVFYEYICEGKSYSRAAFCCGTNVVFRRTALSDIGGFNEVTVTEDFATSFDLHLKGWDTLYLNRVFVYSLAPENLAAYFMQQSRWSFGSLGTGRTVFLSFLKNPFKLRLGQWFEYFLSVTYYWVGWANFFFMLLPICYIFLGIRPMRQDVVTYLAVFVPYFIFSLNMFYSGMASRGRGIGEMVLGQQIGFISFPIHMASAVSAVLGRKRPFGVTPKGVGGRLPWKALWPQITMLVLSALAFAFGVFKYAAGLDRDSTAIVVNSGWALYHVYMLGSIFTLNQAVREGAKGFFDNPAADREPYLYPQPERPTPSLPGVLGRTVVGAAFVALALVLWTAFSYQQWVWAPAYPVNVAIFDRTVGQDGQEHRSLTWTLNYLKVQKQPGYLGTVGTRYNWHKDYYGFVPGSNPQVVKQSDGQTVVYGETRPLPDRFRSAGVVYLADAFGEFSAKDASGKTVIHRSSPRGVTLPEAEKLASFVRLGGLVMAEWNVLGYPTRPGKFNSPTEVDRIIREGRTKRLFLELQKARYTRMAASLRGPQAFWAKDQRDKIDEQLQRHKSMMQMLEGQQKYNVASQQQALAASKLEDILHVNYLGWYGRYVENFGLEKEYDPALYQSVKSALERKAIRAGQKNPKIEPKGAGFVFFNINRTVPGSFIPEPIVIQVDLLDKVNPAPLARIIRSTQPGAATDELLRGVQESVPARAWFGVVRPGRGTRTLSYYKLRINSEAAQELRNAKFPGPYISPDGTGLSIPALVISRDVDGALQSVYFAGDAAEPAQVPPLVESFPGLANASTPLTRFLGAYPSQYYWGFYEPVIRNVFVSEERIRYKIASPAAG